MQIEFEFEGRRYRMLGMRWPKQGEFYISADAARVQYCHVEFCGERMIVEAISP